MPFNAPPIICASEYFVVDGIGFFVEYAKRDLVTEDELRRRTPMAKGFDFFVVGEDFREVEGKLGEYSGDFNWKVPGFWIYSNKTNPVVRYPYCERLDQSRNHPVYGPKFEMVSEDVYILTRMIDSPHNVSCPIHKVKKSEPLEIIINGSPYYIADAVAAA